MVRHRSAKPSTAVRFRQRPQSDQFLKGQRSDHLNSTYVSRDSKSIGDNYGDLFFNFPGLNSNNSIGLWDETNGSELIFLTNNRSCTTPQNYKEWWNIKSFFKLFKQNLKRKSFAGRHIGECSADTTIDCFNHNPKKQKFLTNNFCFDEKFL